MSQNSDPGFRPRSRALSPTVPRGSVQNQLPVHLPGMFGRLLRGASDRLHVSVKLGQWAVCLGHSFKAGEEEIMDQPPSRKTVKTEQNLNLSKGSQERTLSPEPHPTLTPRHDCALRPKLFHTSHQAFLEWVRCLKVRKHTISWKEGFLGQKIIVR